jgi:hypothetical protein
MRHNSTVVLKSNITVILKSNITVILSEAKDLLLADARSRSPLFDVANASRSLLLLSP